MEDHTTAFISTIEENHEMLKNISQLQNFAMAFSFFALASIAYGIFNIPYLAMAACAAFLFQSISSLFRMKVSEKQMNIISTQAQMIKMATPKIVEFKEGN